MVVKTQSPTGPPRLPFLKHGQLRLRTQLMRKKVLPKGYRTALHVAMCLLYTVFKDSPGEYRKGNS